MHIADLDSIDDDACYRAMDWLHQIREKLEQQVFDSASGDHHYIIGEKLRSSSPEIRAALSRQGRYQDIAHNMRVKEVKVSENERFVICHNPEGATRDAVIRTQLITSSPN